MISSIGTARRRSLQRKPTRIACPKPQILATQYKNPNEVARIPILEFLNGRDPGRDPEFVVGEVLAEQRWPGAFFLENGYVVKLRWSNDIDPYDCLNEDGEWDF